MDRLKDLLPDNNDDNQQEQVRGYLSARRASRVEKPMDDPEYSFLRRANIGSIPPPKEHLCPRCQRWVSDKNYGQIFVCGRMEPCPECSPTIIKKQTRAQIDKSIRLLSQNFIFVNMQNLKYNPRISMNFFPEYADQKAKGHVLDFISGKKTELLLSGPPGRGKSGLAQSAVYELHNQGVQVLWLAMHDYTELRKIDRSYDDDLKPNIEHIATLVETLVVDDLGVDSCNDKIIADTITLLEKRHNNELRTLITSNHNMDSLCMYWKLDKFQGMTQPGDRLISRMNGWYRKYEIPASYPEMR